MAQRYWYAKFNMGYAGTETSEEIDLLDYVATEQELNEISDDDAEDFVSDLVYQMATKLICVYVEPASNK